MNVSFQESDIGSSTRPIDVMMMRRLIDLQLRDLIQLAESVSSTMNDITEGCKGLNKLFAVVMKEKYLFKYQWLVYSDRAKRIS